MASEKRACLGAGTESCRMGVEHAQRCLFCRVKVRDDMVDHHFFGFAAGCDSARAGIVPVAGAADALDD